MCGRYTITVSIEELMLRYYTNDVAILHYAPKYNAAPTQFIPAVIGTGSGNRIGSLRWGLVPSWSKPGGTGGKMINLRTETLRDKPSFRRLLSTRRCIVPADGFYEWRTQDGGKQPFRITMRDDRIFSLAAVYDIYEDEEIGRVATCSIITTEPNELMKDIHHRMPVIIRPEEEAGWLNRDNRDTEELVRMLKPYDAREMRAYPVSRSVGNVRNDTRALLEEA